MPCFNMPSVAMSTIAPVTKSLPIQEHVYLPGVSYATYEALVTEIEGHRRLRITYDHGRMEIMSRGVTPSTRTNSCETSSPRRRSVRSGPRRLRVTRPVSASAAKLV